MSKIAFTTLLDKPDSPLSPHFGKAKWLTILDTATNTMEYVRNTDFTGRSMVELLRKYCCEEVVFNGIGPGALRQLKKAGIAGWLAPADVPISQVSTMLLSGRLRLARKPTCGSAGHQKQSSSFVSLRREQMGVDKTS
jgi:predicted Fe-Mo cluster-binding NifX family protein